MILSVCPNPSVDTFLYFDKFVKGGVNRLSGEKHFPGGKGVHVAIAVAELGHDVSLLGFWGGSKGKWMLKRIGSMGVKCYGPEIDTENRSCYTFKTNDKYNDTEILGAGPVISNTGLNSFYERFEELLEHSEIVVFSGSWPGGVPDNAYLPMIELVAKANKKAIIDTSERYLRPVLNTGIFGIHLNNEESEIITGKKNAPEQNAFLSEKFKMSAVTHGKKGLHLSMGNEIVYANVTLDEIYSAVGSGDCLTAGLAVGLETESDAEEIAKLGVACGAANCLREDLGMFYKKDVDLLLDKVEITKSALK
jgi:tagatose 6-phosphate kinase